MASKKVTKKSGKKSLVDDYRTKKWNEDFSFSIDDIAGFRIQVMLENELGIDDCGDNAPFHYYTIALTSNVYLDMING